MIQLVLTVLVSIVCTIYLWAKYVNGYWHRNNVPYVPAKPLVGNVGKSLLFQQGVADLFSELYQHENGEDSSVLGIQVVHKPGLLIKDPEVIKNILVKDFNSFSDRYSSSDRHSDKLGAYNIFLAKNPIWRQMRIKLTPIFTSARMKQMFYLVAEVGTNLNKILGTTDSKDISKEDLRDYCARYTTDVIATCAYGVNAKSIENPNSEFRKNGKKIFELSLSRAYEFLCFFFIPQIVSLLKLKVFSKDTTLFLRSTINHVMAERENNGIKRHDLIDTLIQLKNEKDDDSSLKFQGDILIAQAAVFFSAGFETTSSLMSFALYELAWQPKLQERLRQEIYEELKKNNGKMTYDAMNNMEYLHMVCMETLRLYPPLPYLDRECTEPNGYSLKPFNDYKIPYRMPVFIPIFSIQRDPKFFPKPNEFDPERFSEANKPNITPYTFIPFGTGPHNCIGERFGLMSGKSGLINFLRNHKVAINSETTPRNRLNKKAFVITPEKGIFLTVTKDPLI